MICNLTIINVEYLRIPRFFITFASELIKYKYMNIKKQIFGNEIEFLLYDNVEIETQDNYVSSAYVRFENKNYPDYLEYVFGENKKYFYFNSFSTNISYRNKGYGRSLLKNVKKYYEDCYKGNGVLYLAVGEYGEGKRLNDKQLVEFYSSEGFKIIEHDTEYMDPYHGYVVMAIEL